MKQLVLNVKDNKLQFFLELIKNFDFISIEDDWYSQLSEDQKASIEQGLTDIKEGRVMSNEDAMAAVKAKIQSLR